MSIYSNFVNISPSVNTALEVLRNTGRNLDVTQRQMSSGLRVQTAQDNATYWTIATTTRSDIGAVSAVQDSLGLAAATVNVASTGMSSAIDIVSEIKSKLVAASEGSVDKTKVNDELTALKEQLRSAASSSSFNGVNWIVLDGNEDPTKPHQIPGSFIRSPDGTVSVGMLNYEGVSSTSGPITSDDARFLIDDQASNGGGYGVLTSTAFATEAGSAQNYVLLTSENGDTSGQVEISLNANTTTGQLDDMVSTVDAMLKQMVKVGSAFGSLENRVQLQSDFASNLNDSLTTGVGKLVDANMEQQSSKLLALQTQQQLGTQSLSIANASLDVVRQLFQNL